MEDYQSVLILIMVTGKELDLNSICDKLQLYLICKVWVSNF